MCVFVFDRARVSVRAISKRGAEVAAVGADEPEPARAVGEDVELTGVMRHVVAFTEERLSHESRVADALRGRRARIWHGCEYALWRCGSTAVDATVGAGLAS
jgi:hypothetical protein